MDDKKVGKIKDALVKDILSAIYKVTLQVASGFITPEEGKANQEMMARKLVGKHNVANVIAGLFYAYWALAKEEVEGAHGRTGRITVMIGGGEQLLLRPFFLGIDSYMYSNWPAEMDEIKKQVCNKMLIGVEWGMTFMNYPYDPEKKYTLDAATIADKDVEVKDV